MSGLYGIMRRVRLQVMTAILMTRIVRPCFAMTSVSAMQGLIVGEPARVGRRLMGRRCRLHQRLGARRAVLARLAVVRLVVFVAHLRKPRPPENATG